MIEEDKNEPALLQPSSLFQELLARAAAVADAEGGPCIRTSASARRAEIVSARAKAEMAIDSEWCREMASRFQD